MEAGKDKLERAPELNLAMANDKMQDLEPTMNEVEDVFTGFTKATADGGSVAVESTVDLAAEARAQQEEEEKMAREAAEMEQIAAE